MIDKGEVKRLLQMCVRAEGFCRNARPATSPFTKEDLYAEPTEFYSGSSGYAGATMREVICTLESSLEEWILVRLHKSPKKNRVRAPFRLQWFLRFLVV